METSIEQGRWDDINENIHLVYKPHNIELREVFERYLSCGGECFEVGCYPGRYLIYMGQTFGYSVSGIDATPLVKSKLPEHIREHGVSIGELFCGDFFSHTTQKKYDAVISFGFIEHFYDTEKVMKKHIDLLKDSGTLIVACPNFRRLQYLMHLVVDPQGLRQHVLSAMDLGLWRDILERNSMKVLEQGYWRTADFWTVDPRKGPVWAKIANIFERITKSVDKRVKFPNSFLSPFMYTVAKKSPEKTEKSL